MRIFIAVPLPEEVKSKVSEIMRGRLPVSYVNTTNLHITLNFFGELTDDEVGRVKKIFVGSTDGTKPFAIEFDQLVKFHQQIHLTVKPNQALSELQNKLEKMFHDLGFMFQDRRYYPHVKLANLHMDHVMNQQRKLENFPNQELQQLNFTADRIVLYESKLLLHHAHYYPLIEIKLL